MFKKTLRQKIKKILDDELFKNEFVKIYYSATMIGTSVKPLNEKITNLIIEDIIKLLD